MARALDHLFLVRHELGLHGLQEADCLGGQHVHQRSALRAREDVLIDFLAILFARQNHAGARSAERLVRGSGDDMRMAEGGGVDAARDQTGEMGHVDHE